MKRTKKVNLTTGKKSDPNKITNFYAIIPDEFNKTYHNPNFKKHLLKIPFRMLIVGGSGSGKTSTALEMIHRMSNTFEKIIICCKSKEEPLYEYLESKIPKGALDFYEGIENVPNVDEFKGTGQMLAIFDDLVLDKNQSRIEQFFIRGRKIGGGISCMYLSQAYYKTPKTIRVNCNYMVLKKLSSKRDLKMILSEFSLGKDVDELTHTYKYATSDQLSFLLIDVDAPDEAKFRRNFLEILV